MRDGLLQPLAIWFGMLSLVMSLVYWIWDSLDAVLEQNEHWIAVASRSSQGSITADLFASAVAAGLIYYDPKEDRLRVLTRREFKVLGPYGGQDVAGLDHEGLRKAADFRLRGKQDPVYEPKVALDLLWQRRGPGAQIRILLIELRRERLALAVRDALLTSKGCEAISIQTCETGRASWSMFATNGAREDEFAASTLEGAAPSHHFFARMNFTSMPYGDWAYLSGDGLTGQRYVFKPTLADDIPGSTPVRVDVVGSNITAPEDWKARYFCATTGSSTATSSLRAYPCSTPANAIAVRYHLTHGQWRESYAIEADAARLPLLSKAQRALYYPELFEVEQTAGELPQEQRIRLSDRISLICGAQGCKPRLATTSRLNRLARDLKIETQIEDATKQIEAAQALEAAGEPVAESQETSFEALGLLSSPYLELTGPNAYRLTDQSTELRLASAIGVPGASIGSYMGFLENLPPGVLASDLSLTFAPELQKTALDVFEDLLLRRNFKPESYQNRIIPDLEESRRAGFVLLDLQAREGAILAAVNYPFYVGTSNLWDLKAGATLSEANSILTPASWRGLDARFQPGSSFKLVSALSLARTALGETQNVPRATRERIAAVFLGGDKAAYDALDFRLNVREVEIPRTRRSRDGTFTIGDRGSVMFPPSEAVQSACKRQVAAERAPILYGVCEALARSSNIWFGTMAQRENTSTLEALYDPDIRERSFTGLGQTLAALGAHKEQGLVRHRALSSDASSFAPSSEALDLPSAPGLAQGELRSNPNGLHHLNASINSYGQNVLMTPLGMATIAASIAQNRVVTPFLATDGSEAIGSAQPLLARSQTGDALMTELRRGLRAVMLPGGTGYAGFSNLGEAGRQMATRVYAKTGTAEFGPESRDYNTSWFVGWVNGTDAEPRYAFACAISHVSGGSPCSAVTAKILLDLQEKGRI